MTLGIVINIIIESGDSVSRDSPEVSIINHTLPSTIRAVIGTPGTSIASNSTSASECY